MKRFRKTVEDTFEIPFDSLGLPTTLKRVAGDHPDAFLYATPGSAERLSLMQPDMRIFAQKTPPVGHCLVGFWGHGTNSYAFYLSRVTPGSAVHFRLPYGGGYGDEKEDARRVREFLTAFLAFERSVKDAGRELLAIDSMADGSYRVSVGGLPIFSHGESMLMAPRFDQLFDLSAPVSTHRTIYDCYAFWREPDGGVSTNRAGRYLIANGYLHILEDNHGDLEMMLPPGPMDAERYEVAHSGHRERQDRFIVNARDRIIVNGAKRRGRRRLNQVGSLLFSDLSRRREFPRSSTLYALFTRRSRMASAAVGSPIHSCHFEIGN